MSDSLDLKSIEKKAFRATYQDGLWDIYIGGIVLCMAELAYNSENENLPLLRLMFYLLGVCVFYLIYWGGRKFLTTPRLGQVKFGPHRQRRKLIMASVLAGMVLLQVMVLIGTVLLWRNPSWATDLSLHTTNQDLERMVVAVVGALFIGPSMVLIAYYNDFLRGYYIAFIMSLAVFCLIWFSQPIYLIGAGLLIMLPGIVLFVRFMQKHPLPPPEANHD